MMISIRSITVLVFLVAVSTSLIHAQDLSNYRGFQFGMNLNMVAKQAGMNLDEVKTLHQRPAMIQELWWLRLFSGSSTQTDLVRAVVFSFYNDDLFRMVVEYDWDKTKGLTDEDMIETFSAKYGLADRPLGMIILFSSSRIYNESEKVLARWEDPLYSYNLYRSDKQGTFGMLIFSKRMDGVAQDAIAEAIRLDSQEKLPEEQGEVEKP